MKRLMFVTVVTVMALISCANPTTDGPVVLESLSTSVSEIGGLQVSESESFTVLANYSDGSQQRVTSRCDFTSQNEAVATVSSSGSVLAESEGSTTITVEFEGKTTQVSVTTIEQYQSLTASVDAISGEIGDSIPIVFTLTHTDGTTEPLSASQLRFEGAAVGAMLDGSMRIFDGVDGGTGTMTARFSSQSVTVPVSVPEYERGELRTISEADWERKAVSYSGYRSGQSPDAGVYPSEAQILEDLRLLHKAGFSFLRLYDTGPHADITLQTIKEHSAAEGFDFIVQLGVWIGGAQEEAGDANWEQIDGAVELLQEYPEIIVSVSVGNETMVDWNDWWPTPPEDIRRYIQYVRTKVDVPVTTDDNWEPFSPENNADTGQPYETMGVAEVVDYLAIHTYPLADSPWGIWDWKQEDVSPGPERAVAMMDEALAVAKDQYQSVRDHLDDNGLSDLPIIIGETGWKHTPTDGESHRAHPVNAKMYYDRIMEWVYGEGRTATGPRTVMYFEAFDEPWKAGDDGWGLFSVDREPYYVLYAQSGEDDIVKPADSESYTIDDALYFPEQ